ncbi:MULTISPECIES: flagellar basal body-associated protein FliL [Phyllobacterium]
MPLRVFSIMQNKYARCLALVMTILIGSNALLCASGFAFEGKTTGLADATIAIIRHGEKPDSGTGLSPAGEKRAQAYSAYFQHLTLDGRPFRPDTLIATADSKNSARERLTLEPLSQALGLPIDLRFGNKDLTGLTKALRTEPHGKSVLIAWHHGTLSQLIEALGGDPSTLLPGGQWPDDVFDYMVVLRFDHKGKPIPGSAELIHEDFANPPGQIGAMTSH